MAILADADDASASSRAGALAGRCSGAVYFTADTRSYALDKASRELLWRYDLGDSPIGNFPGAGHRRRLRGRCQRDPSRHRMCKPTRLRDVRLTPRQRLVSLADAVRQVGQHRQSYLGVGEDQAAQIPASEL